jgi:hypothetical protein
VHLAGALADAGEHRVASVRLGDVVDKLHNEHSLADTSTAEEADLATLRVRRKQVHNLIFFSGLGILILLHAVVLGVREVHCVATVCVHVYTDKNTTDYMHMHMQQQHNGCR